MSHVVTIQTQVRDSIAIAAACNRLSLPTPAHGEAKLFGTPVSGWIVQLPGWNYPVVCNVAAGEVRYDNFQGRWGDQRELDRFLQAYAIECAKLEARRRGHAVTEQAMAGGSVKLVISVMGGAS